MAAGDYSKTTEWKPARKPSDRTKALEAQLSRLRKRLEDCDASRLYWRARCRAIEGPGRNLLDPGDAQGEEPAVRE